MSKPLLVVTVSGGRTSAYMAIMLVKKYSDVFDFIFIFCNTGEENEATLEFVHKLEVEFNLPIVWLESVTHHGERKSSSHKVVNYQTASRNGEPFRNMISKYGIPHVGREFCTRELKLNPIRSYMRELGFNSKDYMTAVGIRIDEGSRIRKDASEARIIYPLICFDPSDKIDVLTFWERQSFDLQLEEYQGNCKTCYKKSFSKLFRIADENPEHFQFNRDMERDYYNVGPDYDPNVNGGRGRVFFRTGLSTDQLFKLKNETYVSQSRVSDLDASGGCAEECGVGDLLGTDTDNTN